MVDDRKTGRGSLEVWRSRRCFKPSSDDNEDPLEVGPHTHYAPCQSTSHSTLRPLTKAWARDPLEQVSRSLSPTDLH